MFLGRHRYTSISTPRMFFHGLLATASLTLTSVGHAQESPQPTAPDTQSEASLQQQQTKLASAEARAEIAEEKVKASEATVAAVKADAEKQVANAEAASAVAKTEALKAELSDAKAVLAEVKSGKLMSSGLTLGGAIAVHTGTWGDTAQIAADASAMPYVLLAPGYLSKPEYARAYCAASWIGGGSGSEATSAALAASRLWAKAIIERIIAELDVGVSPVQVAKTLRTDLVKINPTAAGKEDGLEKLVESLHEAETAADKQRVMASATTVLANFAWNPTYTGKCGWTRWGLWVGKPLAYKTSTKVADSGRRDRDLEPIVSAGIGFSPHAYITILAGVTLSNLKDAGTDGMTDRERTVASITFGIGGNADIIGSLFK